ncbi:ubiquitin carboxyl-terminal hydrolase 5 isoform X1 [Planococcus citri]|uniref:ubiquitin carboxyl-terminal hydrolase 5 isoform X1 n=1 Tax=Planococcus citri TaxID=170843 RepID=UPI0031F95BFF
MDNHIELLKTHISSINVPQPNDKVYKDECVYSFDSPFTDTGLYVCMKTFYGLGKEHLERHHRKTGSCVYVHMKYEKILLETNEPELAESKKPTRLAIGVQGGFDADPLSKKFETRKSYSIVILPQLVIIPWPNDGLPEKAITAVYGIINAESASRLAELESGAWDGEIRAVTKHTNLVQVETNKKVPPSGWKCERCELTTNLWLNLTDGAIMCGRKFFDGTGGNEHALKHFHETGYPLAVKLGTITKDGKADVFSYDEDDMVEDPHLVQHLAHFGINTANMVKSDKSMVELELDLNQKFGEWAAIQEAGSNLQPLYGPGYTGLNNLGNSCYLNSSVQVLFTVPGFIKKYVEEAPRIFDGVTGNPAQDFNAQMAKLGTGLLSGKYSHQPEDEYDNSFSISPNMFKTVIGKGHPAFSSKNQQDAQEFFLYLLTVVERNSRHQFDPTECFKFKIEERYQCRSSSKVQYFYRTDSCLPLMIPLDAAINKSEVLEYEAKLAQHAASGNKGEPIEIVRPRIKFESCLQAFIQSEVVDQFYSSAIKGKTEALKTTRLSNFPQYLIIHLKKYTLREDWTPVKLDVSVEVPDILDLSALKGLGLQPGEELLPSEDDAAQGGVQFNEALLAQLMDMGFPIDACKRALHFTKNENLENATNWLMEHIDDPSIMEPFTLPKTSNSRAAGGSCCLTDFVVDEAAVAQLISFGFTRNHVIKALQETSNSVERAADWLFNHPDDGDTVMMDTSPAPTSEPAPGQSSSASESDYRYRLKAFISHMGPSPAVGHYVCHINKQDKWVIYNDEKVALSENPPKDLGYVYFFERI